MRTPWNNAYYWDWLYCLVVGHNWVNVTFGKDECRRCREQKRTVSMTPEEFTEALREYDAPYLVWHLHCEFGNYKILVKETKEACRTVLVDDRYCAVGSGASFAAAANDCVRNLNIRFKKLNKKGRREDSTP